MFLSPGGLGSGRSRAIFYPSVSLQGRLGDPHGSDIVVYIIHQSPFLSSGVFKLEGGGRSRSIFHPSVSIQGRLGDPHGSDIVVYIIHQSPFLSSGVFKLEGGGGGGGGGEDQGQYFIPLCPYRVGLETHMDQIW